MKNDKKVVMAFGTFDIFHKGHESYLRQARLHGDRLVAVVARDETVKKIKGNLPVHNENQRMDAVKKSGLADEVVMGSMGDKYAAVEKYRPDVICLGYDQDSFVHGLQARLKEIGLGDTKILRMQPFEPEVYKSSKLKNKILR